jgi:outer membrane lipoprotein SlyB
MIDINKFLQLNNPDIARQTRNMSYFDALKSEIPGTKSYQGYNPFYKGADKTGLGGYLKQGIDSVQGKFKPGSNVGGATWLTRKIAQDSMRLGIAASSIGRSILGRTLGTVLGGTVAGTAGILTSPYIAIANHLYGPNVQKAHDFVGTFGEAMPFSGDADMYPEYSSYLGKQGTSQTLSDTVLAEPTTGIMNIETPKGFDYNFDENVLKEEEDAQYNLDNKRSFNMDGMLQNLGGYAKDAAGRYIGSQALGGAGAMLLGPVGGVVGGIAGLLGGRDLFNSPYIGAGAYTMDQYGNMYTADQLNKMNARGGYYSEPARDSRRRDQSIRRMEERKAQGLQYGINRLDELKEQAAQEEAARQSAVDAYFGGSDAGADSGRFDGASSRSEYDSNPTGYSGPF